MAETYHDVTAKHISYIANMQSFTGIAIIFENIHFVNMNRDTFRSHLDFPFVANFGGIIVENRKLFKVFVPPIHFAAFFVDIFVSYFHSCVAVVMCVAAHDDFGSFGADGGVGGVFKMLVGSAAIVPLEFVIPFRKPRELYFYGLPNYCDVCEAVMSCPYQIVFGAERFIPKYTFIVSANSIHSRHA